MLRSAFRQSLAVGGLPEITFQMLLTRIEETCHQLGAEAMFAILCHEMAAELARAGIEAPFQQWYLAPAAASAPLGEPRIQEEFVGEGWHPSLVWQDVTGRSRVDPDTRPGWLGIYPAQEADLWPEKNLDAPRLVVTVRGDFVAQTRVDLAGAAESYAGLLVWQDEQHFARLEIRTHRLPESRAGLELAACVAGRFRMVGRGNCDRQPMWLRVERAGEELRGLCSADGEQWLACGSVRMPCREGEVVGLTAHSGFPDDHAWFDAFLLWQE
jgi:regulation of enolase protein 1 (concanavalin A-like superfamily)